LRSFAIYFAVFALKKCITAKDAEVYAKDAKRGHSRDLQLNPELDQPLRSFAIHFAVFALKKQRKRR
jgi:hypothetical protein